MLENPNLADPIAQRAKWEKVIHKLSAGLMPPPGEPRPSNEAVASLVSYLETTLDRSAPAVAGAPVRRLTRAAYGNAVRDLLGFPVDVASLLPPDISSDGFDNVSDTLKTSPLLLERYLTVGLRVAAMAVGDTKSRRAARSIGRGSISRRTTGSKGCRSAPAAGSSSNTTSRRTPSTRSGPELWRATGSTVRGVEGFKTPFELQILLDDGSFIPRSSAAWTTTRSRIGNIGARSRRWASGCRCA